VGGKIEVHIHPDTFDRRYVNSAAFENDILKALARAGVEGRY
jgi:hypothetical protein